MQRRVYRWNTNIGAMRHDAGIEIPSEVVLNAVFQNPSQSSSCNFIADAMDDVITIIDD